MKRVFHHLLLALSLCGQLGLAAVLQVPDPYPSIQAALDLTANGDTVLVAPGHYHERLVIPPRLNLTLGSHTLITGDTLFIPQTIIDGDSLGRVIVKQGGVLNRFILDGFTIRGGVGYQEHGGGIDIQDHSRVLLQNLFFEHNYSTWYGACIFIEGRGNGPIRAELRNIQGSENHTSSMVLNLISVLVEQTAIIDGLRFNNVNSGLFTFGAESDTCIVRNVYSSGNVCNGVFVGGGMSDATEASYQEYHDINISQTQWQGFQLMNFGGTSNAFFKNIHLIDNVRIGDRDQEGHMFRSSARGWALCDSLVLRGNRGAVAGATGAYLQVGGFAPDHLPVHGVIHNLIMEDNVLGDSTHTEWNLALNYPSMLTTENYNYDGAVVRNNTVILTPGANTPDWGETHANVIRAMDGVMDSSYFRDMLFENNLVIDRDDNDALPSHWANEGRCLTIEPGTYESFIVDNVVFDHNLQPNMFAEEPYGGEFSDGQDVGSVFLVQNDYNNPICPPKFFRNVVFRNNQDGGMRSKREIDLRLRNVQMTDMQRQGLDLQAQRVELDNVLIDGCEPYAPISFRSEQMPLRLEVTDSSVVRNCTIINCTTPYVVMSGLRYPDSAPGPVVHFENCLFANNQYDRFEALISNYTGTPGWDPYVSGEFNNCLLQEAPDVGANNLIGVDPLFDLVWGAPYLATDSPCIDAGNPGILYNDIEDTGNPGFALWPSHGTLHNDIGVTGGPLAAVIDTNWVGIGPYMPRTRPKEFTLGNPYPNPFNPVAHFPFTLIRPMPVHIAVHNLLGQEVAVLVDRVLPAGTHQVTWRPTLSANGVYIVTLTSGSLIESRSVILLK